MRAALLRFGHPAATLAFWERLVRPVIPKAPTPFYLFSAVPLRQGLDELASLQRSIPVPLRHWLSCKTQPVPQLLQWWRRHGLGIEVVSEFELKAALHEGFEPEAILVNGPAKHHWLPRYPLRRLRVNFDSSYEAAALLPLARRQDWSLGVRCQTSAEFDPEFPDEPTQFGLQPDECVRLLQKLRRAQGRVETIHFHLRTNVASPSMYQHALEEVAGICQAARFAPRFLDCGGGIPPPHILSHEGRALDADFQLDQLARIYRDSVKRFPGLEEIWLENGRFLSARSGILVVRVLDAKVRRGSRQLICDGGRTLNALISTWEHHQLFTIPRRSGKTTSTVVRGPTCMAFDQLARRALPSSIQTGDYLVWMDAGAYHIPWETQFSHGTAAVYWHESARPRLARPAESFESWWGRWSGTKSS